MKKFLLAIVILMSFPALSQETMTDTIISQKLNEAREITVTLPASYQSNSAKKYPLLLLLDGDYLLSPFLGALNYGAYWDDLPEMIIVGISQNKNNEREDDSMSDSSTGLPEKKGTFFYEFIGMELLPAIEKKYRVAPFKIIAGHDTTAGFLNFFLYKDQPLFNAYISMSPELPTEMEIRLPQRLASISTPIFYYHSTADGDVKKMRDRILALHESASAIKREGLNYKFDNFADASHYSLVLHSIPKALYQFFSSYQPISSAEFAEKIVTLPSGYVDYLENRYTVLEEALGYKMQIRYNDFKAIEAAIIRNKAYNEFDKLSDLARKHYPNTMLSDYHMAVMYENTGDLKRAQKSYMKAFNKEEIGDLTKDMMFDRADALKKM
ncbi:MAG: alpha/beta hydrolase [Flavobacterium sp.]|nr:alpha/beta hydrolase [Flavobacterium sp.]